MYGGGDDDPFAVQLISLCPESRKLAIAGASSHVVLFKFRKQEAISETWVSYDKKVKKQRCHTSWSSLSFVTLLILTNKLNIPFRLAIPSLYLEAYTIMIHVAHKSYMRDIY